MSLYFFVWSCIFCLETGLLTKIQQLEPNRSAEVTTHLERGGGAVTTLIVRSFHQHLWKKWKTYDERNFAFTTCRNVIGWLFQSWCNSLSLLWNTNSWQRTTASTQHHGGNRVDSDRERFWQTFCSLSESLQYFEFWICSWYRLVFKSDSQNHNNSAHELLLIPQLYI